MSKPPDSDVQSSVGLEPASDKTPQNSPRAGVHASLLYSPRMEQGKVDDVGRAESAAALWIFGYGSLMWRPDFAFEEAVHARVDGWQRGFFIYSTHHRGTHARPGLVLALDRGGACEGIAYRISAGSAAQTLAYLRAREQVNGVYREAHVSARIEDGSGRHVEAVAYVAERCHPSYAGRLPLAEQVRLIRAACGISGPNLYYLVSTVQHLRTLGVHEPELVRILALAGPHFTRLPEGVRLRRAAQSIVAACRQFPATAPRMPVTSRRRFVYRKQLAEWALPGN